MKIKDILTSKNNLIESGALIAVGVLFCALRANLVGALLSVIGALLILLGICAMICKRFASGGIEMALGIAIIACGWTIADITLLVLGIVLCVYAIYTIVSQTPTLKDAKPKDKILILAKPLAMLIVGVMFIVAKWYMVDALFIVLGVLCILYGIVFAFDTNKR